jgi:hypothetical protein
MKGIWPNQLNEPVRYHDDPSKCSSSPGVMKMALPGDLYKKAHSVDTLWFSFENQNGSKGCAAMRNGGAKGDSCRPITAHGRTSLMDFRGSGVVRYMWMTFFGYEKPEVLRSLIIEIYWDDDEKPAVYAPVGDFFCHAVCEQPKPFENALFASPEGRSFNCYVPMPFKKQARIMVVNNSEQEIPQFYYCIEITSGDHHDEDMLYFHTVWRRENRTALGRDFEILPLIRGSGRFLGTNIHINTGEEYLDTWFGEGEVKVYLDGDTRYPTLSGTGIEDYIGSAWGQKEFSGPYFGCTLLDQPDHFWRTAFYRLHIPDPVWFNEDCRVTLQQIGSCGRDALQKMLQAQSNLQVVYEVGQDYHYSRRLLEIDRPAGHSEPYRMPDEAVYFGFYREDDIAAAAYFYLDRSSHS